MLTRCQLPNMESTTKAGQRRGLDGEFTMKAQGVKLKGSTDIGAQGVIGNFESVTRDLS